MAVEMAHSGWAQADCLAELPAYDSPTVVPAGLWAAGLVQTYSAPAGLVVLTAHGSTPADYSQQADPSDQHSLDARPVRWLAAELMHGLLERYKAPPFVSHGQRRGR